MTTGRSEGEPPRGAPDDDGGFGPTPSTGPLPTMIGAYQVVGRLGGGAMAELYLAHKISRYGFVRRAVVKRVKRSRPDFQQLQEMLLDEARATACFDHPNLVSLFDVGETDQGVYLALEYVEGSDLRRVNAKLRQRKEALPFELAVFITVEVLRGLHHAHTAKDQDGRLLEIVHRDVNPSNVLIARSGHIKLADFGVVRMRERVQQKTEPGLVKGKYAYLAPEYIAGEPCSIQTDVYAAGIMLFELLSGRECFSGKTAYEVMWKIVNKGVPMYRLEREGVPEDLQRIVQRATAMAPERRYQSAQDMANALEAWLMRSGRHATPWVLSVFFHRHGLLPSKRDTSRVVPLANLDVITPPRAEPSTSDVQSITKPGDLPASTPRLVESALTPLPVEMTDLSPEPSPQSPAVVYGPETAAKRAVPTDRFGHPADAGATTPPRYPPAPETSPAFSEAPASELQTEPWLGQAPRPAAPSTSSKPSMSASPPTPMVLDPAHPPSAGKLEEAPAADVLECLNRGAYQGVVEFRCGLIWKKVKLYDGKPIGVTSNMGMELIGEHLVKSKTITRDQLHRALRRSERDGRPLTATLIEDGALDRASLELELGRNLAARLHEVLDWRWGTFELKDEPVQPAEFVPRLDLDALLTEARAKRAGATPAATAEDSGEFDAQRRLEQAVDMHRAIASSSGRGQIERPWRPEE